jgi:hypothetical protein
MTTGRVLLAADECTGCLAAVRGLRAAGYEPWVGVSEQGTYAEKSRAVGGVVRLPPPKEDERYADRVAELAVGLDVLAVLPGTMDSLAALTGREQLFGGIPVGTSSPESLARATDREELARLATHYGAGTLVPSDLRQVLAARPARREAGDGEGGFVLCAVSGVVWEGKVRSALHQNAPRTWAGATGLAAFSETLPRQPEREALTAGVLDALGWSGIFHFPLVHTSEGLWLVDFNPYMWGSLGLALAAGHNLVAAWVDLLLGREPVLGPYRVGIGLRVEERDYPALAAEALAGSPGRALRRLLPARRTHHAVLSVHDPWPAGLMGLKLASAARGFVGRRGSQSRSARRGGEPPREEARATSEVSGAA